MSCRIAVATTVLRTSRVGAHAGVKLDLVDRWDNGNPRGTDEALVARDAVVAHSDRLGLPSLVQRFVRLPLTDILLAGQLIARGAVGAWAMQQNEVDVVEAEVR